MKYETLSVEALKKYIEQLKKANKSKEEARPRSTSHYRKNKRFSQ